MELVGAAAESGAGDVVAPGLAEDGGAEEAGRVVGWEAEEEDDLASSGSAGGGDAIGGCWI